MKTAILATLGILIVGLAAVPSAAACHETDIGCFGMAEDAYFEHVAPHTENAVDAVVQRGFDGAGTQYHAANDAVLEQCEEADVEDECQFTQ